jgi:hypothetical protein
VVLLEVVAGLEVHGRRLAMLEWGGGRRWQGEVGCPASLASGMSDKAVLEDESVEAEPFSGLDGIEEGWRWLATVESKAAVIAVE